MISVSADLVTGLLRAASGWLRERCRSVSGLWDAHTYSRATKKRAREMLVEAFAGDKDIDRANMLPADRVALDWLVLKGYASTTYSITTLSMMGREPAYVTTKGRKYAQKLTGRVRP